MEAVCDEFEEQRPLNAVERVNSGSRADERNKEESRRGEERTRDYILDDEQEVAGADQDSEPHGRHKTPQTNARELAHAETVPELPLVGLAHDEAAQNEKEIDCDEATRERARPIYGQVVKHDQKRSDTPQGVEHQVTLAFYTANAQAYYSSTGFTRRVARKF